MAKKTPEERGYIPVEDAARELRQLADGIERDNAGRLAKLNINVWYEDKTNDATNKSANALGLPR